MRTFSKEFTHAYESYQFGYRNYAAREPGDRIADIYAAGYLPYSGDPAVCDTFYMARSARIRLADADFSSENRRVAKRFDDILTRRKQTTADIIESATATEFCLTYFRERHGARVMPKERLRAILTSELPTSVLAYEKDGAIVAYVLEVADETMAHFWYSFYDLAYTRQSLGMWLLLDTIKNASEARKQYVYVGTAYGAKARYKLNLPALEYWTGESWSSNIQTLKKLAKTDSVRIY